VSTVGVTSERRVLRIKGTTYRVTRHGRCGWEAAEKLCGDCVGPAELCVDPSHWRDVAWADSLTELRTLLAESAS